MSQVETLAEIVQQQMAIYDENADLIEQAEYEETRKIPITTRFDELQIFYIDEIASRTDISRSGLVNELASSALVDLIEKLGLKEQFAEKFVQYKMDQEEKKDV